MLSKAIEKKVSICVLMYAYVYVGAMFDWLQQSFNPSGVILCLEVRILRSL